ncbi:hypothetical protein VCRA2120E57_10091 [Vibrio crassostreae]|nr:hypothetical protein VCRA2120E57_10091 [Vibrio crassostreae]
MSFWGKGSLKKHQESPLLHSVIKLHDDGFNSSECIENTLGMAFLHTWFIVFKMHLSLSVILISNYF